MNTSMKASWLPLLPVLGMAVWQSSAWAQEDKRPLATRWQTDYVGAVELGVDYVTDDNFMFGRYNGRYKDEAKIFGNVDWRWANSSGRWDLQGTDIGTDVPFARIEWDRDKLNVFFEIESSYQVSNDSGRSPFRGDDNLTLPVDWEASNVTSGFTTLYDSMRGVDQELDRDRYSFGIAAQLTDAWKLETSLSYEEKDGTQDIGAAIFPDASSGHSAILPQPVDYETTEVDLALSYNTDKLQLNGSWHYSDFDNGNDLLQWQNPYDIFGPAVAYDNGTGGLGLAPDNEYNLLRLLGTYRFSPTLRFQVDGSYAKTEQDQNFAAYTVNENLSAPVPVPRSSLDGELETYSLDARVFYRPWRKLKLEGWFHGQERDYDVPRDGYQYVLGDGGNQVDPNLTVYNSAHDYTSNEGGIEGSYPLPWKSKLWLTYEYEEIERENSAVDKTEEDRYKLRYRIPILSTLSSRLEVLYAERAADTYHWDQSYYSLLDTGLINQTPDNRRYITHPLLSQYHLANRDRTDVRLNLDWQPGLQWNVSTNLLWREDDYNETELGLSEEKVKRAALTASWVPNSRLSLTAYTSYDDYEREQTNRAFRGGVEKNAFEIYPPLPQASDPSRNWGVDNEDEVITVGFGVEWQPRDNISLMADYSYVNTDSDYDFSNGGAADLSTEPLPADDESEQHHLILEGAYHLRENLSIKVNYQYWNYDSEDWAIHDLSANSIDKVLTLGEQEADEDLHYIGTSIIYRWQ
jgi:MtrB/PioB family decaheme-associated outer membrane protein